MTFESKPRRACHFCCKHFPKDQQWRIERIETESEKLRSKARREALEECEKLATEHAEFCRSEAHNGGSHDLYERASGAAHLAEKYCALMEKQDSLLGKED